MASTAAASAPTDKTRNILLAKVHLAKKQLGLDDGTYEGVLIQVAGTDSAKHCTIPELRKVVAHFEDRGFVSIAKKPGQRPRADHALARKARVMWISLSHLCAVREEPDAAIRADKGLETFAKRQLKCTRFQWADRNQGEKLVEALKKWAERHGWDQSAKGLAKVHYVHALKVRLCDAILVKLVRAGIAKDHWTLREAAFRLTGIVPEGELFTTQDYERIAAALGRKLRDHGGQGAFNEVVK
ncbi:gp16 family protein [Sphingobium rhizovicinum]|uniref:Gp16 family protein n=1 Tax=Sphingobium rhizovicinum TaxID=432308 RepID=A0ABV7NHT9_9SPHN